MYIDLCRWNALTHDITELWCKVWWLIGSGTEYWIARSAFDSQRWGKWLGKVTGKIIAVVWGCEKQCNLSQFQAWIKTEGWASGIASGLQNLFFIDYHSLRAKSEGATAKETVSYLELNLTIILESINVVVYVLVLASSLWLRILSWYLVLLLSKTDAIIFYKK